MFVTWVGRYALYVRGKRDTPSSVTSGVSERPTVDTADEAWGILEEAIESQGMGIRLSLVSGFARARVSVGIRVRARATHQVLVNVLLWILLMKRLSHKGWG